MHGLNIAGNDGVCAVYFMAHYTVLGAGFSFLYFLKFKRYDKNR